MTITLRRHDPIYTMADINTKKRKQADDQGSRKKKKKKVSVESPVPVITVASVALPKTSPPIIGTSLWAV